MKTKKPWWKNRLGWALALSCLFHVAFLAVKFPELTKSQAAKERKLVVMTLDDPKVNLTKIKENILMREME